MAGIIPGWDYLLVFPLIQQYLSSQGFPRRISTTAIQDFISDDPQIKNLRIVRMEWCIHHGIREFGYRKDSRSGNGYSLNNLGVIVPICV